MPVRDNEAYYSSVNGPHAWRPGVFRRFPVLGVAQLIGALIGIGAAIAIIVLSDGSLISDWKYSPAVYLTICYTISNILLSAAFSQGVTLSWWNKATKEGTVIGDLHRYHAQGTGAWAALTSGRHFSFIAFATLFVTLTPINGPLLQRSSTIGSKSIYSQASLELPITRTLWDGTGFISGRAYDVPLFSQRFNDVVQAYYRGDAIAANSSGCPTDATCAGRLAGAGLAVNCSTASADYDLSETTGEDANGNGITRWASVNGTDVFQSNFYWNSGFPGNMSLGVQFKSTTDVKGQLVVKNCTLQTATVQYSVVLDGNSSTISLAPGTSVFDDVLLSMNPYALENSYGQTSEIGGYAFALRTRFNAWTHLRWVGAAGYELRSQGPVGPQFASMENVTDYYSGTLNVTFADPTMYLLNQARDLMFRTALAQGNGSTIETVQGASQTRSAGVYVSHYDFLAIAVAISAIAFIVVLTSFGGYWHLGRQVTMSPIETAKAFNAPLLAHEDSNATAEELVKSAGTNPVQYGLISEGSIDMSGKFNQVVATEHSGNRFEIADPAQVRSLRG